MKQIARNLVAIMALLIISTGAWADGAVNFVYQLNGNENMAAAPGVVTYSINEKTCVLTATPNEGNYLISITAVRTIDGSQGQGRTRAPGIDEGEITITATDASADKSGETTYTLTMPDSPYDVQVTANFGNRISIEGATLTLNTSSFTYDGNAKEPTVTGIRTQDGADLTLTAGTDYTINYSNNTNVPGTDDPQPTVTIAGINGYSGEASAEFTIAKADPTITAAPTAKTLTYNAEAQALVEAGTVSAGTMVYSKSIDGSFSETIPTETNAGTYSVYYKVNGNDNYNGIEASEDNKVSVTISPATITEVTLAQTTLTYTGSEQTVTISSVKAGSLTLTADDYNVSGNTGTDKNTYTVTVTAKEKGNFTGTKTAEFTIGAKQISDYEISLSATSFEYNGSAHTPEVTFKEDGQTVTPSADDYEVAYSNNINVASADAETGAPTVTVTGKNNLAGSVEKKFSITAKSLATGFTVSVDATQTYTYNSSAIEPAVTVTPSDGGTALVKDKDYTVSYSNNTNAAAATDNLAPTVTVTGKGNYTGSASAKFTIAKADPTITAAPTVNTLTYNAEAQALVEAGTVSAGTMVYSETIDGTFSETIPTETNAGTYSVYYKVNGNDNYNGIEASEDNKVSVTISPATITEVTLAQTTLTYTGSEQTVTISSVKAGSLTLTADDYNVSGNTGTDKGTYTVTVTAKENGNFTGSKTAEFTIVYNTLSSDGLFGDGHSYVTYINLEERLDLPETVRAYIITGVSGNSVTVDELNYIPAEVPVLLEKTENVTSRPTSNPEGSNILKYASENASIARSDGTLYVLYNDLFVRATNNTVAAGNIYLQVDAISASGARSLSIKTGDGTTSIESVDTTDSSDSDRWYDMQGRRIERPIRTGIYINNGKKVVIK